MPKFKIHGQLYEPSCDGSDRDGFIHFWDVVEAPTVEEAMEMTYEDYGEYNTLDVNGTVTNEADERRWLAKNPS